MLLDYKSNGPHSKFKTEKYKSAHISLPSLAVRAFYLEDSVHAFDLQAAAIYREAMLHHRGLTIRKPNLGSEAIHRVLQGRKRNTALIQY